METQEEKNIIEPSHGRRTADSKKFLSSQCEGINTSRRGAQCLTPKQDAGDIRSRATAGTAVVRLTNSVLVSD